MGVASPGMTQGFPIVRVMTAGLVLVLAACGNGDAQSPVSTSAAIPAAPPEESSTTTTVAPTTTSTVPPPPVEDLLFVPESFRERLVELVEETQRLRGLSFPESLSIEAVTSQDLSRRLRARVEDDPEAVELNGTLFGMLGLVDPDTDWPQTLAEFQSRPTPGIYDVSSRKLWLVSTLDDPSPLEEMTLVGEIAKALVDHNLGIWERRNRLSGSGQSDSLTVLGAMAQADSSLVELLFAQGLNPDDQQRTMEEAWALSAGDSEFPRLMHSSQRFSSGPALDFLQRLYQTGGWELINDAHRRPPLSTEQILTLSVDPLEPLLLPRPGVSPPEGYREVTDAVWGQWGWNTLLSSALGPDQAASASWGWGGDRYLLFSNGQNLAMVVDYRGDTVGDTLQMRMALEEYLPLGMEVGVPRPLGTGLEYYDTHYAWLSGGEGGEVLTLIAATDVELGRQLRSYRFG